MKRVIDLTGQSFGRWTVIHREGRTPGGQITWLCRCVCGTERHVSGVTLREGQTRSCGCLRSDVTTRRNTTHGMTKHPLYWVWAEMLSRCNNPAHKQYADYGGRGIKVCRSWHKASSFLRWARPRWRRGLVIDRINNNSGYRPGNCRFTTHRVSAKNRRPFRKNRQVSVDDSSRVVYKKRTHLRGPCLK